MVESDPAAPLLLCSDGDKTVNQGKYSAAIQPGDPSLAVMNVTFTSGGFKLTTKRNADFSKLSNPVFVPVVITEGSAKRTVTIKVDLTDNKLTNTDKTISVMASSRMWTRQTLIYRFSATISNMWQYLTSL